ncbi:MAG: magnesium/cobalt transporter CorA [Turicibacter sp.]|nr:magnesium/cobalt transporter CorA [Turicibacter sp.]
MIRIQGLTTEGVVVTIPALEDTLKENIRWFWVDLNSPSEDESRVLKEFFDFHPLAIEDCLKYANRPKVDAYADYWFVVFNRYHPHRSKPEEFNVFLGEKFLVTYHAEAAYEIDQLFQNGFSPKWETPHHGFQAIFETLVNILFAPLYEIEDQLAEFDGMVHYPALKKTMNEVYKIRINLSKLRKTALPMRDLSYRVLNMENIGITDETRPYFGKIYSHLAQLNEIIEDCQELTADIRDSYFSLSGEYLNGIMKTLTLVSMFFMPLTFITGLYGMNFTYMPELQLRHGYLMVWVAMVVVTIIMYGWFKKKKWFE